MTTNPLVDRLLRHTVVRPLELHAARHTFASLALAAGRSIRWSPSSSGTTTPSSRCASTRTRSGWRRPTSPSPTPDAPPECPAAHRRPPPAPDGPSLQRRTQKRRSLPGNVPGGLTNSGARDRARTGDVHVGNVVLYQLSYSCAKSIGKIGDGAPAVERSRAEVPVVPRVSGPSPLPPRRSGWRSGCRRCAGHPRPASRSRCRCGW